MTQISLGVVIIALPVLLLFCFSPATAATTQVRIVLYADDGYTILNETTVDYRWMEANLPVMGDGTTHYYHQGPVFVDDPDEEIEHALRWNPEEDTNVDGKGMGALKGTKVKDLCELVGGMQPDEEVRIVSSDGWSTKFAYKNVYEYSSREGPMVITWYNAAETPGTWEQQGVGYVPNYYSGMRLVWFADTSVNPYGIHAFGNYDWHEAADEEYWYYYMGSPNEKYPTTTGLSGKYISEIHVLSNREPEGSVEVTSDPAGARVYLDEDDTGMDTPCTLDALSEGYYSITVQKAGYLAPEEQFVEVIAGKKTPVRFELEPIPQGGGSSGSDSWGDVALTTDTELAILAGSQLPGTEYLCLNGSFSVYSSKSSPFTIKGGEEQLLSFDSFPSNSSPVLLRLYLFLERSSADPGIDAEPQIVLSSDEGETLPVRAWSEPGDDEGQQYAMTLVFVPPLEKNGIFTIRSKSQASWNSTVAGALLLVDYEEPGGTETGAWICEGADLIGDAPGLESPMTMVEFSGAFPAQKPVNATISTATTPSSAAGNLTFFIEGVSMPGRLVSGKGAVAIHEIPLSDISGSAVRLQIGAGDSIVTNRVAILTMEIPQDRGESPDTTPTGGVTPRVEPTSGVSMTATGEATSGISQSPGGQEESGSDPIGAFLCWLHNLVLKLEGKPAEPCYLRPVSPKLSNGTVLPTRDVPDAQDVPFTASIDSIPAGAAVFLDGQPTGSTTPCELTMSSAVEHTIRVEKDGYQPSKRGITGPAEMEFHLLPVSPAPTGTTTSAPEPAASHHGGLFIQTYPEQAEITIDGIVVGISSPILIAPLKEGFHTITAGILTSGSTYSSKETIRTWVFPHAIMPVEFNLMDTAAVKSVTIGGESYEGKKFTVNGYYPVKRIPEKVELAEHPSFITLLDDGIYYSLTIPASSRESGEFVVSATGPVVCNLSVESDPDGAEIFLDGIRTGLLTPAVIPNVSAGYHRISITLEERVPVTELIHIAESQCLQGEYQVRYPLEWYASGGLHLTSDPPGAAVSFRGLKTGEVTPCTLDDIPIGVWEVTLTFGKTKKGIDATVEPGKTRTYSVVFG